MKFAFLVHPLSQESKALLQIDNNGGLRKHWGGGGDLLEFCDFLHDTMSGLGDGATAATRVRVIDKLQGLVSSTGAEAEGRLYEIPMDVAEILDDPAKAVSYMEEAVDMAAEWGAGLVGLGSMTGIVGGQGTILAERGPLAVTTGNSLTVYAAIEALHHSCTETNIDLSQETVAVIGIPGSIAAVAAKLLRPQVKNMLLVARRESGRAKKLARELDAELLLDIPTALRRARVSVSATSTGGCIHQEDLQPGSVLVDIGVPADVEGTKAMRDDVLILSGGLSLTPETMPRDSMFLGFHHGVVPSCLGETITLALENRKDSFSLGRNLSPEGVQEIGAIAKSHGFNFGQLLSFGLPVKDSTLTSFLKATARLPRHRSIATQETRSTVAEAAHKVAHETNGNGHNGTNGHRNGNGRSNGNGNGHSNGNGNGHQTNGNGNGHTADKSKSTEPSTTKTTIDPDRAATLHSRYINPVMLALGGNSGMVKTLVRGEGCHVWDAKNEKFLDFISGFGSMNCGHNHPRIVAAISEALQSQAPGYAQAAVNPYAAKLAERLVALSPPGLEMAFFANSGTESVEAALKLARLATERTGLLFCDRSYHGKSFGALSVTGNPTYQKPFGPLLPDCQGVPYGDLESLERALTTQRYAAFIVEPLQGEGGMIVPPEGYLREVSRLCRANGTLMIVDEVQTGMGRTGAMFACEREGVEPDVMTLAKSLGGGLMPIGAMLCRRDLWNKAYGTIQTFSLHTSTFGGGSLACAAALAAIDVIVDERLAENAVARGEQLRRGLHELTKHENSLIGEVRGEGLMIGLEMIPLDEAIAEHWKQTDSSGMLQYMMPNLNELVRSVPTMYVMQTLLKHHGIYCQVARSKANVLRVQPPLTITEADVDKFIQAVALTCRELETSNALVKAMISKAISGHNGDDSETGTPAAEAPVPVAVPAYAPADVLRDAPARGDLSDITRRKPH